MSSLSVRLAIVMAQSSSLAASTFVIYNNFKPTRTLKWFFTKFLPKKVMQLFNLFIKLIFDALKDIKKALLKILKDIWAIIQYAFNQIKKFVSGIAGKIAAGAKKIIKDIEKAFTGMFKKIEKAFTGIVSNIGNGIKKIPGKITGAGKKVIKQVGGAGKKVVKDISNSGKRAVKEMEDGISNLGRQSAKAVRDAPARGAREARKAFSRLFRMR